MQSHNSESNQAADDGVNHHGKAVLPPAPREESHHEVPTNIARGTGWKLGVAAVLLAVGLGGAFVLVQHERSDRDAKLDASTESAVNSPTSVDVVRAKYAEPTQTLLLPGETRAWYETTIYARVPGYVDNWTADIGDRVTKGQVLAAIDTPELDQQLNAAKAKVEVSNADVKVMQANADLAESNYKRWSDSGPGVVSELERVEKKAEADSAVAKLNAAKSQVDLDQADVDRLNELEKFKKVKAPFDGVITARRIDIGDLVTAGSTASTTSLYSIAQVDQMRVFVDVPQSASRGMDIGTVGVATANEYPGRKFEGKIARTSRSIDPNARTLRVEVDMANPDLAILPGMYLDVAFEIKQNADLEVPAAALVFRSTGPAVAVVGDDDKVNFHNISIARDQGEMVEVGSGLAANDRVALNISNQIADGDRVTAVETDKPTADASAGKSAVAAVEPH